MVVLATKLYVEGDARERALDSLRSLVDNEIGDLAAEFDLGVRHDEFPSVTIEGDDATVARNVLREEFGEIVPDLEAGETYVGTLESWDDDGFVLDAGQGDGVRIPTDELGLGPGSLSRSATGTAWSNTSRCSSSTAARTATGASRHGSRTPNAIASTSGAAATVDSTSTARRARRCVRRSTARVTPRTTSPSSDSAS